MTTDLAMPDPGALRLPYPGLRSFTRDETDLFFGRDSAVHTMLRRLRDGGFLAVLGASGSGKSSLVRTGLLDGLELGLLAEAGAWWRVIDIRPGTEPMRALAQGLCPPAAPPEEVEQLRAWLMRGPRALLEWAGQGRLQPGENLLVLVDQFEELFRYRGYEGHQEAEAFVALLLESARASEVPIHVTLTMRSEYLGACALFDGLAEAMNEGQYLTPRMSRELCRAAIEGPAAVCGFRIEPDLVSTLLNDLSSFAPWEDRRDGDIRAQLDMIGRRADQLPLLQHALNQLWMQARDRAGPGGEIVLTRAHYLGLGGLQGTIDQHARQVWASMSAPARDIGDQVFRALTAGSTVAEAVRRPTRLGAIVASIGPGSRPHVLEVIEAFRSPGRNFLTPAPPEPLTDQTTIDISHESLIRQWSDLSGWLSREAQDADQMRRLDEAARRNAEGSGELLSGRDLAPLAVWRKERRLPAAWAERYVSDPERAFVFLDASIAAALRQKNLRRALIGAGAVAGLAFAVVSTFFVLERNKGVLLATENLALQETRAELEASAAVLQDGVDGLEAEAAALEAEAAALRAENLAFEETYADIQRDKVVGLIHDTLRSGDRQRVADQLGLLVQADPASFDADSPLRPPAVWLSALDRAFPRQQDTPDFARGPFPFRSVEDAPESPFMLRSSATDDQVQAVVDARTGRILHEFAIPTDVGFAPYRYAVSMSGTLVLMEDETGRLLRWEAGRDWASRVMDRVWLRPEQVPGPADRDIDRVIFDEATGEVAIGFRQYGTDFLTVLPRGGASDVPVWPDYKIAMAVAGVPSDSSDSGDFDPVLRVLALRDGAVIFPFSDAGGQGLASFDATDGTARLLLPTGAIEDARPTSDPDLLHVLMALDPVSCRTEPAARASLALLGRQAIGSSCLSVLDLATGQLTGPGRPLPYVTTVPARAGLPLDPLDPAAATRLGGLVDASSGTSIAAIDIPLDPDRTPGEVVHLDWWGAAGDGSDMLSLDWATIRAQTVPGGLIVWDETAWNHSRFDTRQAAGVALGGLVPGRYSNLPTFDVNTDSFTNLSVSLDGKRMLALDQDLKLIAHDFDSLEWSAPLRITAHATCLATAAGPTDPQPGKQDERPARTEPAPVSEFYTDTVTPVRPLTLDGEWTLVRLARPDRLALLQVLPSSAGLTATLLCPAGPTMTSPLAIDPVLGRVALTDRAARRVFVWQVPQGPPADWRTEGALSWSVSLPGEQSLTAADLFGPQSVAVLTSGDDLTILPLQPGIQAPEATAPQTQRLALPGATRLSVNGTSVLVARSETGGPAGEANRWITLGVFAFDRQGLPGRITHAGALPLSLPDMPGLRLADDQGGIEVATLDAMIYRMRLPVAPDPDLLAADILSLSSPAAVAENDQDAANVIVSMLPSLRRSGDGKAAVLVNPAQACAGAVEAALRLLEAGSGAGVQDTELAACAPDGRQVAALIRDLALARTQADVAFPPATLAVLHAAVKGDPVALRGLMAALQGDGLNDSFAASEPVDPHRFGAIALLDGWPGPFALASPETGDPDQQARFAAAAEAAGDVTSAYRHAGRAEQVLALTGDPAAALPMRRLRLSLGARLPVAVRAAEATALQDWQPGMFGPPRQVPGELKADLAAMDALGQAFGDPGAAALLKVDRLLQEKETASSADLDRQSALDLQLAELVIAVQAWPERTATLTRLPEIIAMLRQTVTDESLRLKLDAATVALFEGNLEPLPFDFPNRLELYEKAVLRLAALSPDQLPAIAGGLRFGTTAVGFGIRDSAYANETGLALLTAREALAVALPDAPGAPVVVASTPLWRGVIAADLAADTALPDDQRAAARRAAGTHLADALWRMLDLAETGALDGFEEANLLAAAASWAVDHLTLAVIEARFDDLLSVADRVDALIDRVEATDNPGRLWVSHLSRQRDFVEQIAYTLTQSAEETALMDPDPDQGRRMLQALVLSHSWLDGGRKGGRTSDEEIAIDSPDRWTNAIGYAVAWAAPRGSGIVPGSVTRCDSLASSPFDPRRKSRGIAFETLSKSTGAIEACQTARRLADAADLPRLTFLQARVLSSLNDGNPDPETLREALLLLVESAQAGHAAAFNNLAAQLTERSDPFRKIYYQRVLLDHAAAAWEVLEPLAQDDRSRAALLSILREAAALGSLDAHLLLADRATDPVEQYVHLSIAALILKNSGDAEDFPKAVALEERAFAIPLSSAMTWLAEGRVQNFRASPMAVLEPDLTDYIRGGSWRDPG